MNNNVAQASAIIMKMVYDDKFVQMLDQMLSQTKGGKGTENGIAHAVGVVATQIVQPLLQKMPNLPEEDVFGKNGVIHVALDSIFEVAKKLGYKFQETAATMKQAYDLVEEALEEEGMQHQGEAAEGEHRRVKWKDKNRKVCRHKASLAWEVCNGLGRFTRCARARHWRSDDERPRARARTKD